jgi:dihydrofolate reductase
MRISIVVAASNNYVIGKDNKLPWHLPNDMKFFKNLTWAMPILMGRNTYESMGSKPLPGRFNFVVSRQNGWSPQNETVKTASSLDTAIELAARTDCLELFIIGGGKLYETSMAIADHIYMTRVDVELDGDVFFPIIQPQKWELSSERAFHADDKHAYAFRIQTWNRRN